MLTQMFFIWEQFLKIFLNSPMAFGVIFSSFKNPLLPWHEWKSPPKSHLPSLRQDILQIQQVELPHDFSFHLFLIKNIFCLLLWLLEIYKGTTFSPLSFASKPFSLASP